MSVNKIIVFTLVACFIVFDRMQTGTADEFNIDEYVGKWYAVRVMAPKFKRNPIIECEWYDVMKRNISNGSFKQIGRKQINHVVKKWKINGEISNSEIHLRFPHSQRLIVMNVTKYNNGEELIIISKEYPRRSRLISRRPTASEEARLAFKTLAEEANVHLIHIDNDHCQS